MGAFDRESNNLVWVHGLHQFSIWVFNGQFIAIDKFIAIDNDTCYPFEFVFDWLRSSTAGTTTSCAQLGSWLCLLQHLFRNGGIVESTFYMCACMHVSVGSSFLGMEHQTWWTARLRPSLLHLGFPEYLCYRAQLEPTSRQWLPMCDSGQHLCPSHDLCATQRPRYRRSVIFVDQWLLLAPSCLWLCQAVLCGQAWGEDPNRTTSKLSYLVGLAAWSHRLLMLADALN